MMDIDNAIEALNKKKEALQRLDGTHKISFAELFNEDFMSRHTKYHTISEFLTASNLGFPENWPDRIDEQDLDAYISLNSDFSSWHEMKLSATQEYLHKELNK